jgi:hypothetical protein
MRSAFFEARKSFDFLPSYDNYALLISVQIGVLDGDMIFNNSRSFSSPPLS